MSNRNVSKHIEAGLKILEKHERHDIVAHEVYEFADKVVNNSTLYQAIIDAFNFGVSVGYNIRKTEERNKAKTRNA